MTTPHSRLSVKQLRKSFKQRQVVQDFSLDIESGEVVGLLGPNGAGKTTSFYMIVGLVAADHGTIRLDEHELRHMTVYQRARLGLGYLPQEASIFRKMTVEEPGHHPPAAKPRPRPLRRRTAPCGNCPRAGHEPAFHPVG